MKLKASKNLSLVNNGAMSFNEEKCGAEVISVYNLWNFEVWICVFLNFSHAESE
jgi:hypothetical protein